jgi:hypothetical protein
MLRPVLFSALAALIAIVAVLFSGTSRSSQNDEKPQPRTGRNNTVLLLSNSESGSANVVLATSHALLAGHPDMEVHFASFKKLEKAVSRISKFAAESSPDVRPISFHTLSGPTYLEALRPKGDFVENTVHSPGIAGLESLVDTLPGFAMPWSGPEYLSLYKQILHLIEEVDPAVVAMGPLLGPAIDAVRATGRELVVISPNALQDSHGQLQPWGSLFWKYPA